MYIQPCFLFCRFLPWLPPGSCLNTVNELGTGFLVSSIVLGFVFDLCYAIHDMVEYRSIIVSSVI